MKDYRFEYDSEDDVLYIQNAIKNVKESVKISEDIIIDIDKEGKVIGIEIFYASEFLSLFNKELDKIFLEYLEDLLQFKHQKFSLVLQYPLQIQFLAPNSKVLWLFYYLQECF